MFFKKKKKRNLVEILLDRSGDYTQRSEAALSISGFRDVRYFEPLIAALKNDPEPSVRMNAAYALGELSMKAAKEPLLTSLKEDGSEWVRGFCATALTRLEIEFDDVEQVLIEMIEKETDSGTKRHFAHSLGLVGTKTSGPILISLLRNDLDPGVRSDCAEALGSILYDDSYDILMKAAKNDISADVRRQAFVAHKKIEENK